MYVCEDVPVVSDAYCSMSVDQHQQQVAAAVERAKQVTMQELNAIIGVIHICIANEELLIYVACRAVVNTWECYVHSLIKYHKSLAGGCGGWLTG